ncbi:MAG: hypothetical protein ACOCRK_04390 [bacterium]
MTEDEFIEQYQLMEYIKNFNIHFDLLLRRYKRFREINKVGNNDINVITYLDMIIVQLRALCIENKRYKNNYTAQVLLRKVGEDKLALKIDNMLNEDFYDGSIQVNIKTALKILADGFICHYDNFDGEKQHELSLANIFLNRLRNPHEKINLDYIMDVVVSCIGEGLTIRI